MKKALSHRLITLAGLGSLVLPFAPALAQSADDVPSTMPAVAPERSVRQERPALISLGGLWPKGLGPAFSWQLTPQLALGAQAGWALFFADISAFGRWYFAETPGSWYVEGLAVQHFPLGTGYLPPAPFFSINALGGWEYRDPRDGITFNIGAGLGVSPNMTPNLIVGLINLDASIGYAF